MPFKGLIVGLELLITGQDREEKKKRHGPVNRGAFFKRTQSRSGELILRTSAWLWYYSSGKPNFIPGINFNTVRAMRSENPAFARPWP